MQNNSINRLIDIIKKLRAPDGCPWDREQTHKSIRGHLVEECAELLEAIDLEDPDKMREELGDILMHVALHAEIASENNDFNLYDIAEELGDKLVRRHPHVFAGIEAKNSDDVLKIWKDVKAKEKKERVIGSLFAGIPPQLSSLRYALDIAKKADEDIIDKTNESIADDKKNLQIGKALFDIVKDASKNKIEPESALRDYINQIRKVSED